MENDQGTMYVGGQRRPPWEGNHSLRPEGWYQSVPGRGNSMCERFVLGVSLEWLRNRDRPPWLELSERGCSRDEQADVNLNEPCQHRTMLGWEDKWRLGELFQSGLHFESSLWLLGFRSFRRRAITVIQVAWRRVMSVEVERNGEIPEVTGQGKGGMGHGLRFWLEHLGGWWWWLGKTGGESGVKFWETGNNEKKNERPQWK